MNYSKKPKFKSALDFEGRSLSVSLAVIAEQKALLRSIQSVLPPNIADHALHCVLSGARLIIYTQSSVWASQIRFFHQAILNKIQASGQRKIASVQTKVLPPVNRIAKTAKTARLPSSKTVSMILGQVDDKSNDVLQVSLSNLAKTLGKRLEAEAD